MTTNYTKSIKSSLTLLAFALSLLVSCSSNKKDTDQKFFENNLYFYGLKGKIKSLTETGYKTEEKFGEIQKGSPGSKSIYLFNENGSLDKELTYGIDGKEAAKTICIYDKKGNIIEVNYFRDGSLETKLTYKYDGAGNKIERNVYNPNGTLVRKFISKFDGKGKNTEENYYNSNGDLESKHIFKYDKYGNNIMLESYQVDGSLKSRIAYQYDSKKNLIDKSIFNKNLELLERESYKYDDSGKMIEKAYYWKNMSDKAIYDYQNYDKNKNWLIKIQKYFPLNTINSETVLPSVTMIEREIQYY